jgi:hypothetical protein
VRGHLYRLVAPTGTNAIICTGGISGTNEKSGIGYMCHSLVVDESLRNVYNIVLI